MRVLRTIIIIALFMGIGYMLGRGAIASSHKEPGVTKQSLQKNILIIGVDNISSATRLEGLWLVIYNKGQPSVSIIPLFPYAPDGEVVERNYINRFDLDKNGNPAPKFLNSIRKEHGISWDWYVLVGDVSMIALIDFVGVIQIGEEKLNGYQIISVIPSAAQNPLGAYRFQAYLLETLCHRYTSMDVTLNEIEYNFLLNPNYFKSNIPLRDLANEYLDFVNSSSEIQCKLLGGDDL